MAQGVFEHLVGEAGLTERIEVDSAGTHAYHVGEAPDPRSRQCALRRSVDLSGQRARQVQPGDFERFDFILAMDRQNLEALRRIAPPALAGKARLFLEYAPHLREEEVPDPYYGGESGFDHVFDLVEAAGRGLLEEIGAPA